MTDAKAPERIWTDTNAWSYCGDVEIIGATPYVRADLYDALTKERDELRAEVEGLTKLNERLGALKIEAEGDEFKAIQRAEKAEAEVERLAEDRARRLGHIDRNGNPPLTKEELAEFREKNPMDHLALAALAAWVNVRPDQLPKEMQAHNCPATMEAWARVAAVIENALQRKEGNE